MLPPPPPNTPVHFSAVANAQGSALQVDDRAKRATSLWGQMATVLKQIMKQRDAAHFSQPVDTEKLKVRAAPPAPHTPRRHCRRVRH